MMYMLPCFCCRLVYKWFLFVHKATYGLGILGYMVVCLTMLGVNLMFAIAPDTAMEFGVTVLFYGLYFGVLGRDFAEICADKIASKLGVSNFMLFCYLKAIVIVISDLSVVTDT